MAPFYDIRRNLSREFQIGRIFITPHVVSLGIDLRTLQTPRVLVDQVLRAAVALALIKGDVLEGLCHLSTCDIYRG